MSEESRPDLFELSIILFIAALCIASVIEAANHTSTSESSEINMTGVFTDSQLENFCSSKGFDGGYYSSVFGNYTCYNNVDFTEDQIRDEVQNQ